MTTLDIAFIKSQINKPYYINRFLSAQSRWKTIPTISIHLQRLTDPFYSPKIVQDPWSIEQSTCIRKDSNSQIKFDKSNGRKSGGRWDTNTWPFWKILEYLISRITKIKNWIFAWLKRKTIKSIPSFSLSPLIRMKMIRTSLAKISLRLSE